MHSVYLVSYTNISKKRIKTIILILIKPFLYFVVWCGNENVIFRKDYIIWNYKFSYLLLLERYNCTFPHGSSHSKSISLILANSSCFSFECLHLFNVFHNFTPFMFGALKRARPVSQSVHQSVKISKCLNIHSWIWTFVHPVEVSIRKWGGSGESPDAYLSGVEIPRCLNFRRVQKVCNLY